MSSDAAVPPAPEGLTSHDFPVPAGPMPKVIVFDTIAST